MTWKNSCFEQDSNPRPLHNQCNVLPTELSKPRLLSCGFDSSKSQLLNPLRWPIHFINSVDKTKLSCNTPTDAAPQFFLETYLLYFSEKHIKSYTCSGKWKKKGCIGNPSGRKVTLWWREETSYRLVYISCIEEVYMYVLLSHHIIEL